MPSEVILVPPQVDNFEELERLLNQLKTIKERTTEPIPQKYRTAISLLTLALMAIVYIAKDKMLVGVSGTILVGFLSWSFYEARRNKNIDNKTKQAIWLVLLVIGSTIAVMIFKLKQNY
jgi:hypothetical protein